jgi:hypothetical protein
LRTCSAQIQVALSAHPFLLLKLHKQTSVSNVLRASNAPHQSEPYTKTPQKTASKKRAK